MEGPNDYLHYTTIPKTNKEERSRAQKATKRKGLLHSVCLLRPILLNDGQISFFIRARAIDLAYLSRGSLLGYFIIIRGFDILVHLKFYFSKFMTQI